MGLPRSINEMSDSFSSLPGVGPKLSNRIALYLAISNKSLARKLAHDVSEALQKVEQCNTCNNITEDKVCEICQDSRRDQSILMVVETSLELYSIEQTEEYNGLYHVINGLISPVNGIGPEDLAINSLLDRLRSSKEIKEVIFALSTNLEGESTSMYIRNEIDEKFSGKDLEITSLAKGIPVGANLEYLSSQTIADSILRRSAAGE